MGASLSRVSARGSVRAACGTAGGGYAGELMLTRHRWVSARGSGEGCPGDGPRGARGCQKRFGGPRLLSHGCCLVLTDQHRQITRVIFCQFSKPLFNTYAKIIPEFFPRA